MRKILLIFFLLSIPMFAFSSEVSDVREFFDSYVQSANSYSKKVPDYYSADARIVRVVIRPDGVKESVEFKFDDYMNQMKKRSRIAKLVRYKNRYEDIFVSDLNDGRYMISAKRFPMRDKTGLNAYFIVEKRGGGYKIIEESMETPVQDFLKYKK
ncbi:hypothetical protein IKQ26_05340 [bacterium]|nr:hypothetical protein [bacterium]